VFGFGKSALDKGLDAFALRQWKRARRFLEEAALEDMRAVGEYHRGLLYWRGLGGARDVSSAVACFRRAAEEGHSAAQTAYATALRAGVGVRPDPEAARSVFRSAAGAGDVGAMAELAAMSDPADARHWYGRAAELGHAPSMRALSDMLIETDPVEALAWLYVAGAISGDETVGKRAAQLAQEMDAAEIDAAQKSGRRMIKTLREGAKRR
jgi:uncharacterized protein